MTAASSHPAALLLIVAVSILLMLIRPWSVGEVYWVSGGALLLLLFRLVPVRLASQATGQGTDVYLFLTGMMLLSELAREHGVFDWISSLAVERAYGSCVRLFTLVYAIGTLVTILMSNDATAVVLTPAILAVVRKAKIEPLPHLFACALIANAASFMLPISNPANLVVFHGNSMPALGAWLLAFGAPSILSIASTYIVMRLFFRRELREDISAEIDSAPLRFGGKLVLAGLIIMTVTLLTASYFKRDLGLPACLAAVTIAAAVSLKTKSNPLQLLKAVSWGTLLLVAGLFIMEQAVQSVGALQVTQAWLASVQKLSAPLAALYAGFTVAIGNNMVNNLPLGLIAGATLQAAHTHGLLSHAVLIGVDLGPNLSITGSLATILWLQALRKEGLNASFWSFLKAGAIAMPVALLLSLGGAILVSALRGPS